MARYGARETYPCDSKPPRSRPNWLLRDGSSLDWGNDHHVNAPGAFPLVVHTLSPLRTTIKVVDDWVDHRFAALRGRKPLDLLFYVASEVADFSVLWHFLNATLLLPNTAKRRAGIRLAAALGLESILVNGVIKRIFRRERPALESDRAYEVRRPKTASFPSGHASSATLAASLLTASFPRWKTLWRILAAIVAASRVHNRMHHASDVAAGFAVGAVFAAAIKKLWSVGDRH